MPNSLLCSLRYHFLVYSGEHIFHLFPHIFNNLLSDFSGDKLFSFFKWEWKWNICSINRYLINTLPAACSRRSGEALSGNNVFLLLDKWLITSHKDTDVSMSILSQTTDLKAWLWAARDYGDHVTEKCRSKIETLNQWWFNVSVCHAGLALSYSDVEGRNEASILNDKAELLNWSWARVLVLTILWNAITLTSNVST